MIIVKLQGGLGNQMFQYATAKAIGGKSVYIDTDFLNSNALLNDETTKRALALSVFKNIDLKAVSRFAKYLIKKSYLVNSRYIYQSEKNEHVNFEQLNSPHLYLDGYFQNENYFMQIRQQLLQAFQFPALSKINLPLAEKIIADHAAVAIHVRRGDYLKPKNDAYHGVLSLDYYQSAQAKIETQIKIAHYYIFSDDINWCRENIDTQNTTFVSNELANSWEDLFLMSLCKHNIIANSSYSWWGAWLNKNPNKTVIAPRKWFAQVDTEIVPEQWIKC